jgi:hypothetical protein
MRIRKTKLAVILLLVGLSAFVMDFLSPVTPTPTAQLAGTFLAMSLFGLVSLFLLTPAPALSAARSHGFIRFDFPHRHAAHVLLVFICLLLI